MHPVPWCTAGLVQAPSTRPESRGHEPTAAGRMCLKLRDLGTVENPSRSTVRPRFLEQSRSELHMSETFTQHCESSNWL